MPANCARKIAGPLIVIIILVLRWRPNPGERAKREKAGPPQAAPPDLKSQYSDLGS